MKEGRFEWEVKVIGKTTVLIMNAPVTELVADALAILDPDDGKASTVKSCLEVQLRP